MLTAQLPYELGEHDAVFNLYAAPHAKAQSMEWAGDTDAELRWSAIITMAAASSPCSLSCDCHHRALLPRRRAPFPELR